MTAKFNKFERVAGLFVLFALIVSGTIAVGIAVKRGWFERKVVYHSYLLNAEGLHPGTVVRVSGLRAGSVESVDLLADNRVLVKFTVLGKFQTRIREDSRLQAFRPFIIGDKMLEVTVGSDALPMIAENDPIEYRESIDLMDFFSGRNVSKYLKEITGLVANLGRVAQAFSDPKRTEAFIQTFDNIAPLTENLNTMSVEVIDLSQQLTEQKNIGIVVSNLRKTTNELNALLPMAKEMGPGMVKDMTQLVSNLNQLTTEFKKLTPFFAEIGDKLPDTGLRAIEAVDEAVVVLKALQKTWLLSGAAEDVREEEEEIAKREQKNQNRLPASVKPQPKE